SHGLGMTKQPRSWRARNVRRRASNRLLIGDSPAGHGSASRERPISAPIRDSLSGRHGTRRSPVLASGTDGFGASVEQGGCGMKIVVIGGTGLIGSKLVTKFREHGHEAVAASPDTGVNTLTGEGLAEAVRGASVVVDVSNSPSFEDAAVLK